MCFTRSLKKNIGKQQQNVMSQKIELKKEKLYQFNCNL